MSDTEEILNRLAKLMEKQTESMNIEREEYKQREERMHAMLAKAIERKSDEPNRGDGRKKIPTNATPAPVLLHGSSLREFAVWRQKFYDYRLLTGIDKLSNNEQKAVLRSLLDDEWFRVTKFALNINMDNGTTTVDTVVTAMQEHLRSQRNIVLDRKEFFMRNQQVDEKFDDYFISLQEIAGFCDFCEQCIDQQYRDRIVTGTSDENTVKDLLAENNLTLARAVEICRANENALHDTETLQAAPSSINRIARYKKIQAPKNSYKSIPDHPRKCKFCGGNWHDRLNQCPAYNSGQRQNRKSEEYKPRDNYWQGKNVQNKKCKRCGGGWHDSLAQCPANDKNCGKCGEVGHFARFCINTVSYEGENSDDTGNVWRIIVAGINSISNKQRTPKVGITVSHGTQSITIETTPDSGAEVSVISVQNAEKLGFNTDNLKPYKHRLYAADGNELTSLGVIPVKLILGIINIPVDLVVVLEVKGFLLAWYHAIDLRILPQCFPNQINSVNHDGVKSSNYEDMPPICPDKRPSVATKTEHERILKATFRSVFSSDGELKTMRGKPMRIELTENAIPFAMTTARSIPYAWIEQVKSKLKDMKDKNIIREVKEPTDWCHPLVLQPKKNPKEVRICVDLTRLNKYVRRGAHPVLTANEAVSSVSTGAKFFTTMDAEAGYWQIPIHKDDQELTTFITPWGRYKFLRAPMGLSISGDEYNRRGDDALQGTTNTVKVVDDILSYEADYQSHIYNVWEILKKCRDYGITLNPDKFKFASEEVNYCGYVLNNEGFTPESTKVKAITEFKTPTNLKELQSFMGLVNHLGQFSSEISTVAEPLRDLLKKNNEWNWYDVHTNAFERTKKTLSKPPILAYFNPKLPVVLETDAAKLKGLGYALLQKHDSIWKLVDCRSRFFTDTESRYATIELEMLAIVWAVKKCRRQLAGREHFSIITDHKPLLEIVNSKGLSDIENPRLQRLKESLIPYSFTLSWKKGKDHAIPDALSRAPAEIPTKEDEIAEEELESQIHAIIMSNIKSVTEDEQFQDSLLGEIHRYSKLDPEYKLLKKTIIDGFPSNYNEVEISIQPYMKMKELLCIDDDLVVCGQRLVIPKKLRGEILKRLHISHQGIEKTRRRARQSVYWPGIDNDVKNIVNACKECQQMLPSIQKEPIIMEKIPARCFESVSLDYFDHAGKQFLIYTDRYSGWPLVKMFKNEATAVKLISTMRTFFAATGVPEILRADNGPQFTAREFRNFLNQWAVRIHPSSPYYPQSNGHAESSVKAIKHLIIKSTRNGNLDTDEFAAGLLEFRNSPREDGLSPAQVLFGHPIRSVIPVHRRAYEKEWQTSQDQYEEKRKDIRSKVESKYNLNAKSLSEFKIGSRVNIQNSKTGRWSKTGVIVKIGNKRQYLVKPEHGQLIWRNRRHLRQNYPSLPKPFHNMPIDQEPNEYPAEITPALAIPSSSPSHKIPPQNTMQETNVKSPIRQSSDTFSYPKSNNIETPKDIIKNSKVYKNPIRSDSSEHKIPTEGRKRKPPQRLQIDPRRKNYSNQ